MQKLWYIYKHVYQYYVCNKYPNQLSNSYFNKTWCISIFAILFFLASIFLNCGTMLLQNNKSESSWTVGRGGAPFSASISAISTLSTLFFFDCGGEKSVDERDDNEGDLDEDGIYKLILPLED